MANGCLRIVEMTVKILFCTILLCSVTCVHAASAPDCARHCDSEAEPFVQATRLVQPALLNGPNYRVVPEVEVRGYMAHFLIDTPFGPLNADSAEMLAIRVGEIPAIEALDRASKTGAFAHALAERRQENRQGNRPRGLRIRSIP